MFGAANSTYTTSSTAFGEAVVECTLQAPTAGFIVAIGSGSLGLLDQAYEVNAPITVDAAEGSSVDRRVNVYPNASDGTDKSIALSQIVQVAAGPRRISLKARRYSGGEVLIFDPTLAAIFVPAAAAQTVCGSAAGPTFSTQSSTLASAASCQISVAEDSIAFVHGTASMAYSLAPSEARVRLGVDGTWSAASDRWINVYADDQDGTDESMATQFAFPVAAGTHTFDLYAARYDGGGEVTMYVPVLTVAAVPAAAAAISRSSRAWPIPTPPTRRRRYAPVRCRPRRRRMPWSSARRRSAAPTRPRALPTKAGSGSPRRPIPVEYRALDRHRRRCRRRHRPQPAGAMGQRARPRRVRLRPAGCRFRGSGEVRACNAAIHALMLPGDRLFHADVEQP